MATKQVGCVTVLAVGAAGVAGCALIITFALDGDTHPNADVAVMVYVPAGAVTVPAVLVTPADGVKV